MEDYTEQPDNNELSHGKKRRKREGFLASWLQRRHLPLETEDSDEEAEDGKEKKSGKESKKPSLLERLSRLMKNPFKKQVSLEFVPVVATDHEASEQFQPMPADWFETRANI